MTRSVSTWMEVETLKENQSFGYRITSTCHKPVISLLLTQCEADLLYCPLPLKFPPVIVSFFQTPTLHQTHVYNQLLLISYTPPSKIFKDVNKVLIGLISNDHFKIKKNFTEYRYKIHVDFPLKSVLFSLHYLKQITCYFFINILRKTQRKLSE